MGNHTEPEYKSGSILAAIFGEEKTPYYPPLHKTKDYGRNKSVAVTRENKSAIRNSMVVYPISYFGYCEPSYECSFHIPAVVCTGGSISGDTSRRSVAIASYHYTIG